MKGFLNKDERRIIYQKLHPADWEIWRVAHNPKRYQDFNYEYWAKNGYLELFIWAKANLSKSRWNNMRTLSYFYAAENGQLHILQWFKTNDKILQYNQICDVAAYNGHLEIIKWARSQSPPLQWSGWTRYWATTQGHAELLQWAIDHGAPIHRKL
jgi:hypothetical protein